MESNTSPLRVALEAEGRLLRLTLARPAKNILDAALVGALRQAFAAHRDNPELAAVIIAADGPNFCLGASVEEHLPDRCATMLKSLHGLILDVIAFPVPVQFAVHGYCLGGGLELACAGSLIFAAPDAQFGQPEIQLAVYAPAASCLLPERIGRHRAEDILFSGRLLNAEAALRVGLINEIADDPEQAAKAYVETHILPRSRFALRHAVTAARLDYLERIQNKLDRVERQYLDRLMRGIDPAEGLQAFLEKREPVWKHR
jgi:cyclohexa-1,5-dienecarbonyl-CoA hydratase